jgi:phage tail-like protein
MGPADRPFTAFNFSVEVTPRGASAPLVSAAFSDCDGLEMTMEVKTIRAGGENDRQIRLHGPAAYANLTLKRGMTTDFGLWRWFEQSLADPSMRADAEVVLLAADGEAPRARFRMSRCVPVKMRAPALSAKDGAVAVEELQFAYERLTLVEAQ